ncbi:hypothetical protein Tco_1502932 [Tanacetum coccineum]
MEIKDNLDLDKNGSPVDATKYRSMIGALMYLMSSRPDIVHATCLCARYQAKPTEKHLKEVKRIFQYLPGTVNTGLWYTKDSGFELTGFLDADYTGCKDTFKSTSGGAQFLGEKLLSHSMIVDMKGGSPLQLRFPNYNFALIVKMEILLEPTSNKLLVATARTTDYGELEITASMDGQVKTITEASLRRHLKLEDSDDFPLFPTMITTPESSPSRITSSPSLSPQTYQSHQSSPLRDITRQDVEIPQSQFPTQTQLADEAAFTSVDVDARGAATTDIGLETGQGSGTMHKTPTRPHDSPLTRVHTLGKNDLQQTNKVCNSALIKLILRVKKLEKKVKTNKARRRARIVISKDKDSEEDSFKQGRKIIKIDKDPTISLVHPEQDMEYDFDVSTAEGFTTISIPVTTTSASISTVSPPRVSTAEDISGAEILVYIRRSAKKRKDKGKAIMKEDESVQKKTKKQLEQESIGHEEAIRLQE